MKSRTGDHVYVSGSVLEKVCTVAARNIPYIEDVVGVIVDAPLKGWEKSLDWMGHIGSMIHKKDPTDLIEAGWQRHTYLYEIGGEHQPHTHVRVAINPDRKGILTDLSAAQKAIRDRVLAYTGIELAYVKIIVADLVTPHRLFPAPYRIRKRKVKVTPPPKSPAVKSNLDLAVRVGSVVDQMPGVFRRVNVQEPLMEDSPKAGQDVVHGLDTGIRIRLDKKQAHIHLRMIATYGKASLVQIAEAVQRKVKATVLEQTGLTTCHVDIDIVDLSFTPKERIVEHEA